MRRIRYAVAASLDGFIAGPDGEYDWIPMDPDIDFEEIFAQFDTLLMGRRTYEMAGGGGGGSMEGMETWVFSRTLRPEEHPGVTVVPDGAHERLADLRSRPGKDIWLFGGGELFRSLLETDDVDGVGVAVVPVLLGDGVPLLPSPALRRRLQLREHRVYPRSGIVSLEYDVVREDPAKKKARRGKRSAAGSRERSHGEPDPAPSGGPPEEPPTG